MSDLLISVIYLDGTRGEVTNDLLDVLIATGRLSMFKRDNGWIDVNKGKLRDYLKAGGHDGAERRASWPSKK